MDIKISIKKMGEKWEKKEHIFLPVPACLPGEQFLHESSPLVSTYCPLEHPWHTSFAGISTDRNRPDGQTSQLQKEVSSSSRTALAYFPAPQGKHDEAPVMLPNWPFGHDWHSPTDMAADRNLPTGQITQFNSVALMEVFTVVTPIGSCVRDTSISISMYPGGHPIMHMQDGLDVHGLIEVVYRLKYKRFLPLW